MFTEIYTQLWPEVLGPEVDRLATLHTNARMIGSPAVWLMSHADGAAHGSGCTVAWESASWAALQPLAAACAGPPVENVETALKGRMGAARGC